MFGRTQNVLALRRKYYIIISTDAKLAQKLAQNLAIPNTEPRARQEKLEVINMRELPLKVCLAFESAEMWILGSASHWYPSLSIPEVVMYCAVLDKVPLLLARMSEREYIPIPGNGRFRGGTISRSG
jgi:hypothetical protein